jgi:hypothetical protein
MRTTKQVVHAMGRWMLRTYCGLRPGDSPVYVVDPPSTGRNVTCKTCRSALAALCRKNGKR